MADWPVTLLDPTVTVETGPSGDPPDPATLATVDRIWKAATDANPALFDGRIFSADRITADRIVGHWTEYRFAFARLHGLLGTDTLRVRGLAVNGVIRCADGFVVARRSKRAVYQASLWQCAPAGSVERRGQDDRVDLAGQVAAELEEELGLRVDQCAVGSPLAAVAHPSSGVVDVGIPIETTLGFAAIRERHRSFGNEEYEALALIGDMEVDAWLAERADTVAPPTRAFLRLAAVRPRTARRSPR